LTALLRRPPDAVLQGEKWWTVSATAALLMMALLPNTLDADAQTALPRADSTLDNAAYVPLKGARASGVLG
jgi:hypothetical protein